MRELGSQSVRVAFAVLCCAAGTAQALSPSEVFQQVSPSVWAVRGLDADERPIRYGSAVVVGPGQLVTNCHVLAKAKAIQLRRENVIYEASLAHADVQRDLCLLSAKNLSVPPPQIGKLEDVKVGQRVYAIGNPERLALTLSEGLVSGLRGEEGKPLLQTTAPLSPGSSGGGLFDDAGRLIGITTFGVRGSRGTAQNLNFALPAEWIAEVAERARDQLARRHEPRAAPGSAPAAVSTVKGLPPVGATWLYSFQDKQYGMQRQFTVKLTGVEGGDVREAFSIDGGPATSSVLSPSAVRFSARRLTSEYSVLELAPYFFATELSAGPQQPTDYPAAALWSIAPAQVYPEDIAVPAGHYKATRLDVTGSAPTHGSIGLGAAASAGHIAARFHYTAWYAPEVGRYVMVRHRTWNVSNALIGDEVIQLIEYRAR